MDIIIASTIAVCLLASFIFINIAKRLGFSPILGLIVGGIFLGSSFVEPVLEPAMQVIHSLGEIGYVFLMFLAGLEISWSMLYRERKDSAIIAVFSTITPLVLGFLVFLAMGFSGLTAFTIGICMSITAEATKANILESLKKLKTRLGSLMLGAGILDDLIGLALFTIVSYLFVQTFVTPEFVIHFTALAAYFIGMAAHKHIGREHEKISYIESFSLIFIVPFFFISMGAYFSSKAIMADLFLFLMIIVVGIAGKMLGSMLTKPFTKLSSKKLYLIGWSMNSRGAVELAIAFLAFRMGLINLQIFSGLIAMALLTTLLFPIFFTNTLRKNPKIMN